MPRAMPHRAFTLVELLVVITIIVVLLAMLSPALERAIYQAELAVCGAQMRSIGQGALAYASEFKRWYPDRAGAGGNVEAMQLKRPEYNFPGKLSPYVAMKAFIDPFLAAARLNLDQCMADPVSAFMPGYHVYMDSGGPNQHTTPMRRVGDKMIFDAPAPENESRRFGVLIADRDERKPGEAATSCHPDRDGVLSIWSAQTAGNPWLMPLPEESRSINWATGNIYVSWWQGPPARGALDNNYALDDGSVLRLNDVPMMYRLSDDERLTFVPDVPDFTAYTADRKVQLPRGE